MTENTSIMAGLAFAVLYRPKTSPNKIYPPAQPGGESAGTQPKKKRDNSSDEDDEYGREDSPDSSNEIISYEQREEES